MRCCSVLCVLPAQNTSTACEEVYVGLSGTKRPNVRTTALCNSNLLHKNTCPWFSLLEQGSPAEGSLFQSVKSLFFFFFCPPLLLTVPQRYCLTKKSVPAPPAVL